MASKPFVYSQEANLGVSPRVHSFSESYGSHKYSICEVFEFYKNDSSLCLLLKNAPDATSIFYYIGRRDRQLAVPGRSICFNLASTLLLIAS
jgi:hypothetical protein